MATKKKVKTTTKAKTKTAAQGTGQMRKSDQKHRAEIVRAEIHEVNRQVEAEYLTLAQLLNEAYHREYFIEWGFEDWRSYTEDELGVQYRKAMYFVDVWDVVKKLNLPTAQVEKLGWTKMKDLTRVMTEKNAKDWLEKAKKMTTREITEEVRDTRKRETGKATGPETIKLSLIMGEDEGNIILDAIAESKKLCDSENEVVALGLVCQDWLEMKGAEPKRATLEAHCRLLKKVYGVDVGPVDLTAALPAAKEPPKKKAAPAAKAPADSDGDVSVEDLLATVDDGEGGGDVTDALGMAVRRCDLDLARTCFDALWGVKEHRTWLKWRLPVIVVDEVLYLAGELAEFLDTKVDAEADWRRLYYRAVLSDKAKDAVGLRVVCESSAGDLPTHSESESLLLYNTGDPSEAAQELLSDLAAEYSVSEYVAKAIRVMAERAVSGGCLADRRTMLAAMVILAGRGLTKEEALDVSEIGVRRAKGRPRTIPLPWYVFDQSTLVGASALRVFMKRHEKVDGERLQRLWFYAESAFTPEDRAGWCHKVKRNPKVWESLWWPVAVREKLTFGDREQNENVRIWTERVRPEMQQVVEWSLETRRDD